MKKQYKERYGISWSIDTPDEVIEVLQQASLKGTRLHISYGHTEAFVKSDPDPAKKPIGFDWLEEWGSHGYVGCSTGKRKIPLLIYNNRSSGNTYLLDDCIVRTRESRGGRVLWQHPQYHHGKITVRYLQVPLQCPGYTLTVALDRDGQNQANFKNMAAAKHYLTKMGLEYEIVNEVIPATVDYHNLLTKYIQHIGQLEGCDFTGKPLDHSTLFTDEEKAELRNVARMADVGE